MECVRHLVLPVIVHITYDDSLLYWLCWEEVQSTEIQDIPFYTGHQRLRETTIHQCMSLCIHIEHQSAFLGNYIQKQTHYRYDIE